jgi:hypothetical protein
LGVGMRILFISMGDNVDYQCDCLFHGLSMLDDTDVYITNDYWYMFEGSNFHDISRLYGMGFSITNRVPRSKRHIQSEQEIKDLIKEHFYDFVIYGSIFRCSRYIDTVKKYYKKSEIAIIDGEDESFYCSLRKRMKGKVLIPYFYINEIRSAMKYSTVGIYFKRELHYFFANRFKPISFAIPESLIVNKLSYKNKDQAFIYPGRKETYIYKTEDEYYRDYRESKFGVTFKKAGWDCMRHYEILANGCIPYFPDLKKCPNTIMVNFPKKIILETNRLFEKKGIQEGEYEYYAKELLDYTRKKLTTKSLASYVLSYLG